jgi:predicted transcriptional regulator
MRIREMIQEIYEAGFTDQQIADEVEATQPTITRLRTGINPDTSWSRGKRIEEMHRKVKAGELKPPVKVAA